MRLLGVAAHRPELRVTRAVDHTEHDDLGREDFVEQKVWKASQHYPTRLVEGDGEGLRLVRDQSHHPVELCAELLPEPHLMHVVPRVDLECLRVGATRKPDLHLRFPIRPRVVSQSTPVEGSLTYSSRRR